MSGDEDGCRQAHTSPAQLQATLNVIPAYTWYAAPSGGLTFVNKRTADFLGLAEDHPLRLGIDTNAPWDAHIPFLHPDDHDKSRKVWSTCLRTGEAGEVSFRARSAEGDYRWFLSRAEPLRASDGTILQWVGVNLEIEELKRAEQALMRSEAYLTEAQKLTHTGSWAWDPRTEKVLYCSEEMFRIFGLDPRGSLPSRENFRQQIHPEDRDWVKKRFEESHREGVDAFAEYRVLLSDGTVRHINASGHPVLSEDGELIEFIGTATDATERKHAENALRNSELALREIIEAIPALAWRARPDGHIDYVNKRLLEYLGSPLEEIIGWGWMNKVHQDDIAFKVKTWLSNLESTTSHAANCRFKGADGVYRWFNVRGEPLRDAEGRVQKWYGALIDIDDQKKAEEASRESELKLRKIIDTMPSMLWSAGPDGEPTLLNQRVLDYSGLRLENFLKLGWEAFIHPEDFPETARALFHAIQTGESYETVHRLRRADGQYRWHHARGEPLRDDEQRITQWYGLAVDIEDAKTAEDELRDTQAHLARASQAATIAELSASIAHEINQPLAGIVASAQTSRTWLSGDNPNLPRARAAIERIIRDGNAAADIIRRIRALFKQTAPTKTYLNINAVIEEVERLTQDELSRRGVLIELELTRPLPAVPADRIQIQQVLINLIRNGAESMECADAAAKRLVIRSHCTDDCAIVEVCDHGSGLAQPKKIFEPFYSTKPEGLGVGLAISRSIVQAHDGTLRARDNQPKGTVFSLSLPLRDSRDEPRV
jgi:PAS domain S-box-containing protein